MIAVFNLIYIAGIITLIYYGFEILKINRDIDTQIDFAISSGVDLLNNFLGGADNFFGAFANGRRRLFLDKFANAFDGLTDDMEDFAGNAERIAFGMQLIGKSQGISLICIAVVNLIPVLGFYFNYYNFFKEDVLSTRKGLVTGVSLTMIGSFLMALSLFIWSSACAGFDGIIKLNLIYLPVLPILMGILQIWWL